MDSPVSANVNPPDASPAMDVLLVEDNQADLKITLRAFERGRLKNRIHAVKNGQEALDYLYRRGEFQDAAKYPLPDLILLDIMMPKLDGFETLKRIKSDADLDHIPVAMLTTSRNEEDVARSFRFGAVSYIPKPITYEDFIQVVEGFNYYWQIVNKLPKKRTAGAL